MPPVHYLGHWRLFARRTGNVRMCFPTNLAGEAMTTGHLEYYTRLGVDPSATVRDLRNAFARLVVTAHPWHTAAHLPGVCASMHMRHIHVVAIVWRHPCMLHGTTHTVPCHLWGIGDN